MRTYNKHESIILQLIEICELVLVSEILHNYALELHVPQKYVEKFRLSVIRLKIFRKENTASLRDSVSSRSCAVFSIIGTTSSS